MADEIEKDKKNRTIPIPLPSERKYSDVSTLNKKITSSLERPKDLDPLNEKAILSWKGPTKETKSARLRREMNAGKGGRRSISASNEDLTNVPGATEWVRSRLFEQKIQINTLEEQVEDLAKQNKTFKNSVIEKDISIAKLMKENEEKQKILETESTQRTNTESEMKRFKNKSNSLELEFKKLKTTYEEDQVKMRSLDHQLRQTEMSLQSTQQELKLEQDKLTENKTFLTKEVDEYKQKANKLTQDRDDLVRFVNKLRHENEELNKEFSKNQQELLSVKKEKSQLEETCKKYENELTERIKESLSMMDDMDHTKVIITQQNIKLTEQQQQIEKQNYENKQKQNEINDLTESHTRLENTITNEINEKEKLENKLKNQNLKIQENEKSIINLTTTLNEKVKSIQDNMKENAVLTEKVIELEHQTQGEIKTNENLQIMLKNIENNKQESQKLNITEIENLKHEIDDLRIKCELLEHECEEERNLRHEMKTDNEKYKLKMGELKENVVNSVKGMNDKAIIVNNLMEENSSLKTKLKQNNENIEMLKSDLENCIKQIENENKIHTQEVNKKQQHNHDLQNKIKNDQQKIDEFQKQLQNYDNIIKEKSNQVTKLQNQSEDLQSNFDLDKNVKLGQIKTLQTDLDNKTKDVQKLEDINKQLQTGLSQLDKNSSQKETLIEVLKLENKSVAKSSEKLKELEITVETQRMEIEETKAKLTSQVTEDKEKLDKLKKMHAKEVSNLQDELDTSMNKSRGEINELLNNFNELENELSFCQEELNSKVAETDNLRKDLEVSEANFSLKEIHFKTDLESINEQSENILQNEIQKHQVESEEVIIDLKQQHLDELNNLRLQYQTKLADQDERKDKEIEKVTLENQRKYQQILTEKNDMMKKLQHYEDSSEKEMKNTQLSMKGKLIEIESKTRINEKLSRRIETQQKLIDYLMKSLEKERSQRGGDSSKDILSKLSNLQMQFDEKFSSSVPYDSASTRPLTPSSNVCSIPYTEVHFSPPQRLPSEIFIPVSSSSPRNGHILSKTLPTMQSNEQVQKYLSNSMDGNYLSQSMPDNLYPDQGYHSPPHETNTLSFYFAEQIKAISNTFDKIERLDGAESTNDQLSLEMWKQKIHFRLKVLEDQIVEMDTSSNVSSTSSSNRSLNDSRSKSFKDLTSATNVIFHPSTDEIRRLITSVNRKYEHLNKRYINKSQEEIE